MQANDNTPDTIPYGYCHCGCGDKTNIAKLTNTKYGHIKGKPVRYIVGHNDHKKKQREYKWGDTVPSGICHCGCGQKTTIAKNTCSRDGFISGEYRKYRRGHKAAMPRVGIPDGMKRCSQCKCIFPFTEFSLLANNNIDGYHSICKECRRLERQRYLKDHPNKSKEWDRRYRENNADRVRERSRNRRARIFANGGTITAAEWQSVLDSFNGKCAKCGSAENIHMDHVVPLAKGGRHSPDNVQPLCATCNLRKGTKIEDYRGKLYKPAALPLEDAA